jgi:hypothetical protein
MVLKANPVTVISQAVLLTIFRAAFAEVLQAVYSIM